MVLLTATCFGQGVGPPAVGILNDALKNDFGNDAVRYSLPSAGVTTTLGAFLFVWTARFIRADIKRAPLWPCPLIFLPFFPGVASEILIRPMRARWPGSRNRAFRADETILGNPRNGAETKRA